MNSEKNRLVWTFSLEEAPLAHSGRVDAHHAPTSMAIEDLNVGDYIGECERNPHQLPFIKFGDEPFPYGMDQRLNQAIFF